MTDYRTLEDADGGDTDTSNTDDNNTSASPPSTVAPQLETLFRHNGYQTGFIAAISIVTPLTLLWALLLVVYYVWVHSYLIFTQSQPSAAYNGLTTSNVPVYAAAVHLKPADSEVYKSFAYWAWMTDYLLLLMPAYVLAVILFALLYRLSGVGVLGVYVVGIFMGLLELAKSIYFTIYWADQSDPSATNCTLCCGSWQFCMSHNPGVAPGTPSTQFVVAVLFTYVNTVLCFLVIVLPSLISIGALRRVHVYTENKLGSSASLAAAAAAKQNDFAIPLGAGGGGGGDSQQLTQRRQRSMADAAGAPPRPLGAFLNAVHT